MVKQIIITNHKRLLARSSSGGLVGTAPRNIAGLSRFLLQLDIQDAVCMSEAVLHIFCSSISRGASPLAHSLARSSLILVVVLYHLLAVAVSLVLYPSCSEWQPARWPGIGNNCLIGCQLIFKKNKNNFFAIITPSSQ
jgi:hypothetical protein